MTPSKIIIDCDPGLDDAIMLFLAFGSPNELKILGVTTVAGNVSVDKTQRNARMICEIADAAQTPVFVGADRPLVREPIYAAQVHGEEGLEGISVFEPERQPRTQHAVEFILDALSSAEPNEISIVATGPLTNIALAYRQAPETMRKARELVIMGGAMREGGNVTPSAEFNFFADPHAADIVMKSQMNSIVLGLDVTHKLCTSSDFFTQLSTIPGRSAQASLSLLRAYEKYDREKYAIDGAPLHDPCTIAYLLQPELFKLKRCNIQIETDSALTLGHSAVDFWNELDLAPNANWAFDVDSAGFFALLLNRISNLNV